MDVVFNLPSSPDLHKWWCFVRKYSSFCNYNETRGGRRVVVYRPPLASLKWGWRQGQFVPVVACPQFPVSHSPGQPARLIPLVFQALVHGAERLRRGGRGGREVQCAARGRCLLPVNAEQNKQEG